MIYIDEHPEVVDVGEALRMVSAQRREHAMKYRREHDRKLSLSAYLLLQKALKEEYGIEEPPVFGFSEHGKPFLADYPDIHFSLSHCKDAVACVVSGNPVGIDIESIRSYSPELVDKCMNVEEKDIIEGSDSPALEFIRLWTRKESLLKMTGEGIVDNVRDVLANNDYKISTFDNLIEGYVYSVCCFL